MTDSQSSFSLFSGISRKIKLFSRFLASLSIFEHSRSSVNMPNRPHQFKKRNEFVVRGHSFSFSFSIFLPTFISFKGLLLKVPTIDNRRRLLACIIYSQSSSAVSRERMSNLPLNPPFPLSWGSLVNSSPCCCPKYMFY